MAKKRNKSYYFDQTVEDAIVEYNKCTCFNQRSRIYSNKIHPAFDKMVENILNTYKFMYFDYSFTSVKNETISHLVLHLHKFDGTRGFKAFSYFSVATKYYLIAENNKNYRIKQRNINIDKSMMEILYATDEDELAIDIITELTKYFDDNIHIIFSKESDREIAHSIIYLLRDNTSIENYNKKTMFLLVREMTGFQSYRIASVLNIFRDKYLSLAKRMS